MVLAGLAAAIACGSETSSFTPIPANCSLSSERSVEGNFEGSTWRLELEPGDPQMIAAYVDDQDRGALGATADSWYLVESPAFLLIGGTLPSRVTQAVLVMPDGLEFALCPFGGGEPAVVGGVVSAVDGSMDLEVRGGSGLLGIAHLDETRLQTDATTFAFGTGTGRGPQELGPMRSPGVEITVDDTSTIAPSG